MDANQCEYTVSISKTVQVRQYEPTTISMSVKGTCPVENAAWARMNAFNDMKRQINEIFGQKDGSPKPGLGALG